MLKVAISRVILLGTKALTFVFFKHRLVQMNQGDWNKVKMIVYLNHTSLFEVLFCWVLPNSFLWRLAKHLSLPGATKTLDRPIVGFFWRMMVPNVTPITRKRDSSWDTYLNSIKPDDIIMIMPEGRMKRPNGLDSEGKPMSVRGGVADVLEKIDSGLIAFCYSGGLHHIQAPGDWTIGLFKTMELGLEFVDVKEYKNQFSKGNFKKEVIADMEARVKRIPEILK